MAFFITKDYFTMYIKMNETHDVAKFVRIIVNYADLSSMMYCEICFQFCFSLHSA